MSAARLQLPVLKRDGARAVLLLNDWRLDTTIERSLDGVIDVASRGASRRELRFVVVCLLEHARGESEPRDAAALAELIFGEPQPYIRAHLFYTRLQMKHSHFYSLVKEKVVRLAPGSERHSGPHGSPLISWANVVRFIRERRVT